MRKSTFSETQIVALLKDAESEVPVADLRRKHGVSKATFFEWRSRYGGATVSDVKRLREPEAENATLKRMYADLALENAAIKDVLKRVAPRQVQEPRDRGALLEASVQNQRRRLLGAAGADQDDDRQNQRGGSHNRAGPWHAVNRPPTPYFNGTG